jgi:hypothetical protein
LAVAVRPAKSLPAITQGGGDTFQFLRVAQLREAAIRGHDLPAKRDGA